ncbi:MAG: DNA metabolism protein [Clostridiales bacterium]|nr:DNA metabolism protein [Clostridiales bacterium]
MRWVFDGSFEGLMSLVFDSWGSRHQISEVCPEAESESLLPAQRPAADGEKARRVVACIKRRLGESFLNMVREAFLSARKERFTAIVKTIHLACQRGPEALDLLEAEVLDFLACRQEVSREAHRFLGLLRFSQLTDGSLLAEFAPRHHVLPLVLPHFADRFPEEKLIIFDEGRQVAGLCDRGALQLVRVHVLIPQYSQGEEALQDLWRVFFKHLAIKERNNPRLQQQHLPKYTWAHLPEMRDMPCKPWQERL